MASLSGNSRVAIVETGVCNTASLLAALVRAGAKAERIDVLRSDTLSTSQPVQTVENTEKLSQPQAAFGNGSALASSLADGTYSHVVVPGVGSFGAAMASVRARNLSDAICARIEAGRPTLAICVGLQLLAQSSAESPGVSGLGVFSAGIERFPIGCTVPQQAWNEVEPGEGCRLLAALLPGSNASAPPYAFFSNSYCLRSAPLGWACALSVHQGTTFIAGLERGAVLALQFHPELSGFWGTQLLSRWLATSAPAATTSAGGRLSLPSITRIIRHDRRDTHRVIPCLDVRDGRVVKGIQFAGVRDAGDPAELARAYEIQGADELVMLDISATPEGRATAAETVRAIRATCCLPLTVGGGVDSIAAAGLLLAAGADKVAINSAAVRRPDLISELAQVYGSQCVVLAVDAKQRVPTSSNKSWQVVVRSGTEATGRDVVEWCTFAVAQGAGEILLTSFDRDGTREGFDLDLLAAVSTAVTVPVVASGGASSAKHMRDAIIEGKASAVLAASIFHDGDTTVARIKNELRGLGVDVRPVDTVSTPSSFLGRPAKQHAREPPSGQVVVPSIDLMGGRVVQLVGGDENKVALQIESSDAIGLAKKFRIAGEIAVIDLDAAMGKPSEANEAIVRSLLRVARCRVGGGIRTVERARMWLDAGAQKIVIGTAASSEFLRELNQPDRVCVALDSIDGEVVVDGWKTKTGFHVVDKIRELAPYCSQFLLTAVEREGRMEGIDLPAIAAIVRACDSLPTTVAITAAGGVTSPEDVAELDRLGVQAQVGMSLYTGKLDLGSAIAAPMVSDRIDKLWPTVVVDDRTQRVLGLVYSNLDSVREAVRTGTGVFFSRSRGDLWAKGATSGNTQALLKIDLDCDRDALRFTVRQSGDGFCHRAGFFDCFSTATSALAKLDETLAARKRDAPAGSYTQRLYSDDKLLRAKLLEEAAELAAAVDPVHVAEEAADLLYFALVACHKQGASLENINAVLDARSLKVSRRSGDAKVDESAPSAADRSVLEGAGKKGSQPNGLLRIIDNIDEARALLRGREPTPDAAIVEAARAIVADVRLRGLAAVMEHAVRLGDLPIPQSPDKWILGPDAMQAAFDSLDRSEQLVLERTAQRIRAFAVTQRSALQQASMRISGGEAGHWLRAVDRAGCYAPGGRYPLPSTVLMGVIPARVAGCREVWVASPHPRPIMLAAAHVAGADRFLCVGGAQAIAALAQGCDGTIPPMDCLVGPGNAYVTAAKQLVAGRCRIDMLAGPSELLVLADHSANPAIIAADMLGQAEHDVHAAPILITTDASLPARVADELAIQLKTLPTAETASEALRRNGFAIVAENISVAIELSDMVAAEHVEVHTLSARSVAERLNHFGAVFIGEKSAEVFGDYGAGPNHTLPTGGSARAYGGLSVLTFMRVRTWLHIASDPSADSTAMIRDCVDLARLEGLEAHARSALRRLPDMSSVVAELALPSELRDTELSIALPKGRMFDNVMRLLSEAGLEVKFTSARDLRPTIPAMPNWHIKLLKPRNVVEALHVGSRDVGFAGVDVIAELDACVEAIYDTKMDPVRIVLAAPEDMVAAHGGKLPLDKHLRIATEYERLTRNWIVENGVNATLIKTFGSTEAFVPEDADCIVDNTATGTTLRAARLAIVDTLSRSSTHLAVHPSVMQTPSKGWAIEQFKMLLMSAINARGMQMVEFNISADMLEDFIGGLPALRAPTVASLWNGAGYAVKLAMHRNDVARWLPKIKASGGGDVVVTDIKQMVI